MNSSNFRFSLDMHSSQSQISIPTLLGDTSRKFYISLSDGGNPYIIADGCLAKISVKRPTGTYLEEFCAIENNTTVVYSFDQNENTCAVEGIHDCDITLYNQDGYQITSPRFTMVVSERVIKKDDINLSDEDKNVVDSVAKAEASREVAETERVNAEAVRVTAEDERVLAENARESAEASRESAEDERASAEAVRVAAEETRVAMEETRKAEVQSAKDAADRSKSEADRAESAKDVVEGYADELEQWEKTLFDKKEDLAKVKVEGDVLVVENAVEPSYNELANSLSDGTFGVMKATFATEATEAGLAMQANAARALNPDHLTSTFTKNNYGNWEVGKLYLLYFAKENGSFGTDLLFISSAGGTSYSVGGNYAFYHTSWKVNPMQNGFANAFVFELTEVLGGNPVG